jgi:hypothetical protein
MHLSGFVVSVAKVMMLHSRYAGNVKVKTHNEAGHNRAGVSTNYSILAMFTMLLAATTFLAFYNSGLFIEPEFALYFGSIVSIHIITAAVFIRILTVWLRK